MCKNCNLSDNSDDSHESVNCKHSAVVVYNIVLTVLIGIIGMLVLIMQ